MSDATHLVSSLRQPPPPPHLFIPHVVPDTPKELTFSQKDPFFLPQVQIQTSLIRSELLGTIFSTPQFQSNSFAIEEPLVETSSDAVESVQTLLGETRLDGIGLNSDSPEKALDEELQNELSAQYASVESLELGEFVEPEIGSKPSRHCPSVYNQLMKYFSRIGNIDEVLRLFSELRNSNCDINVLCYNTVMNAYVISGRAKEAKDLFDEMLLSKVAPNVSSFNIQVKLYCLSKQFEMVYDLMAGMKKLGFIPDSTTYSTFITGLCKTGRLEEAWGVLDSMKEENCEPTVWTYTPIVEGYCLQGKIEVAKTLMASMESSCPPNTVTYNILIRALCKAGRFDEVEKVLEESQTKGWIPNTITYNTYINGLCKMSMSKEAIEKLQIMRNKGLEPTHVTIGILINCLCLCCDSNFSVAHNLLQKSQLLNCSVGVIGYNTLMSRQTENGRWWKALKILTDMFKKGFDPNERTFNIVVHSLCRGGEFNIAKVLFTCRGFVRNTVAYNTLLHRSFVEGRFNEARVLLSDMAINKIVPDEITYRIRVDGLCREGKFAEATGFLLESLATGVAGDCVSILVYRLVKNRRFKEILQLFEDKILQGLLMDAFLFDSTIRAFCRHGFCVSTDMYIFYIMYWTRCSRKYTRLINAKKILDENYSL